jgi:hypothetical protein
MPNRQRPKSKPWTNIAVDSTSLTLLFGVRPDDLSALAVVLLLIVLTGMLACSLPMRGAIKLDPMEALRRE